MAKTATGKTRANELSGSEWTRLSLSVWRDIRKSREELALRHPAVFPIALVERLIRCFMNVEQNVVLDPFVGSGSVLLAARNCRKYGIGLDISKEYLALARKRLGQDPMFGTSTYKLYCADARDLGRHIPPDTVDFCVTSPPYWDILERPRSADGKDVKTYDEKAGNLAELHDYRQFVEELGRVFSEVFGALRKGAYCVVNIMDIRKKDKFYPLHQDLATELQSRGFLLDDLIIWDRSHEYNNLRPLGYPFVFRINKVHEYLLVFLKP